MSVRPHLCNCDADLSKQEILQRGNVEIAVVATLSTNFTETFVSSPFSNFYILMKMGYLYVFVKFVLEV